MKDAGRIALFLFSATFFDYQFDSDLLFWVVGIVAVSISLSAEIIGGTISSMMSVGGIISAYAKLILYFFPKLIMMPSTY
jgi:H+/Cl- antiporter ClcA